MLHPEDIKDQDGEFMMTAIDLQSAEWLLTCIAESKVIWNTTWSELSLSLVQYLAASKLAQSNPKKVFHLLCDPEKR